MIGDNLMQIEPEQYQVTMDPFGLKSIIHVRENADESWKEVVNISTVSRNGAGFSLTRPCIVGRLIMLVMPLEPELRAYDKKKELYPVMAIVQYCNASTVDGETMYHIGVGFVGKKIPESFRADPTQSYRITGMKKDGLWSINEAESQFKHRKQPRYWISLPVTISLLQKAYNSGAKEETFTKNIGAGGVSAVCSLDARVGEKVKFACKELDFYSIAIVRNRKIQKHEVPTLHLEFIDNEFPIDLVVATRVAAVTAG